MTREEFIIVQSLAAAARTASTMFEAKDAEGEYHPDDMKRIAKEALDKTTRSQMENLWTICDMALKEK